MSNGLFLVCLNQLIDKDVGLALTLRHYKLIHTNQL